MNPMILLGAIPSALGVGALAWLLHTVDVGRIEARQRTALTEQAATLAEQCNADKKLTKETEDGYQKRIAGLNSDINALKLRKPPRCVPVTAKPSVRPHAATPEAKLSGGDGIDSGFLIDYAGRAEECRLKLIGLQGFVSQVWGANGQ